jgi:hypothetical protein
MKSKAYLLLFLVFLTVSCREKKNTSIESSGAKDTVDIIDTTTAANVFSPSKVDKDTTLAHSKDSQPLLLLFARRRQQIEETLKTASQTEADDLYEKYLKENEMLLAKLIAVENNILERFYDENDATQSLVKQKAEQLKRYGLEFDEVGEGMVEIKTKSDFYYRIFKNHVSDDYNAYLAIKKEEDKVSYSGDASLSISFREIGDRVIVWEKLIAKYPQSKLLPKMKEQYEAYQTDYLFGLDNTSTTERPLNGSVYINPENITEFNRFMNNYPQSPTAKLIQLFLKHFKDENIRNLIETEQRKL